METDRHPVERLLQSLKDFRQALDTGDEPSCKREWSRLTSNKLIREAYSDELPVDDTGELFEAWHAAMDEQVFKFIEYLYTTENEYHGLDVDVERIQRAWRGTASGVLAAHAALRKDETELKRWIPETASAWSGKPISGVNLEIPWHKGVSAEVLLDESFKQLPEHLPIAAAWDWARTLVGKLLEPQRAIRVPVLGYKAPKGFVAWLHVELMPKGTGEFYAHPERMGFMPMTASFLEAVEAAWSNACRLAGKPSHENVRWWMVGEGLSVLDGGSLGAAMTVALIQLLRNETASRDCAITAAVTKEGRFKPVEHVQEKAKAAFAHPDPRIWVLVHPQNAAEARAAALIQGQQDDVVKTADSVEGALKVIRKQSLPPPVAPRKPYIPYAAGLGALGLVVLVVLRLLFGWPGSAPEKVQLPSEVQLPNDTGTPVPPTVQSFPVQIRYHPSGKLGAIGDVTIKREEDVDRFTCVTNGEGPHEWDWKYVDNRPNPNPPQFVGVVYLHPPNSFGQAPDSGYDLRGFRHLTWEARSLTGEVWVAFGIGGMNWIWQLNKQGLWKKLSPDYPDSMPRVEVVRKKLTEEWQQFNDDGRLSELSEDEFKRLVGGFWWTIDWPSNGVRLNASRTGPEVPKTFIIELRHIYYQRGKSQ